MIRSLLGCDPLSVKLCSDNSPDIFLRLRFICLCGFSTPLGASLDEQSSNTLKGKRKLPF